MLKINIVGNNSVGRMYRPEKINNSGKRGYIFHTKYKSNYGGDIKTLLVEVNLETNAKDSSEVIKIDIFTDEKIRVGVKVEEFSYLNKKKANTIKNPVTINGLRKLVKPDNYNVKRKDIPAIVKCEKGIDYVDMFIDSDYEAEKELISFAFYPSIVQNEEMIVFEIKATTPVTIENQNGVALI